VIPTNGKRDILSAPAPQSGCAGDWYCLKRKSVPRNSISGGLEESGGVKSWEISVIQAEFLSIAGLATSKRSS
jgi:hypothetical protein